MIYSFVVSFILGIVAENFFHLGWIGALFVCFVSLASFLSSRFTKIFLIVGIAFSLGILRMAFVDNSLDPGLAELAGKKVSFEAVISEEPDVRDASARYTVKKESSKSFILLVADRFPEYKYGDKIKVSGKLELPKNFEEFDYVNYLAKDKIHFLIYRPQIEKTGSGGNKIIAFLYSIKNIFIEKIGNVVPEPNSSLLGGVIFGAKQSLGQELLDDFQKAGLIHIVVLSGYNITIIAAGIFLGMSYFGKRNLSFVLSAIFIILFAIMVGLSATVIRACIMAMIAILAKFLGRPADSLRWLFIAALLMLLWNPSVLFYDPSFQLSFMATLGLILFSPAVYTFISNHQFQKFIPVKFGLREIISSTLAVQIFVLPLLIRMSGFVSVISFVVNPLVLPLVPWAMASGALTGALGLISKILSWPLGVLSFLLTQIIIGITQFAASLPMATLQTGSLSLWIIIVWYAVYAILCFKLKKLTPSS